MWLINDIVAHLSDEIGCVTLGVGAFGDDPIEKLTARHQLHHQIDVALLVVSVEELDDIVMPEPTIIRTIKIFRKNPLGYLTNIRKYF